MLGKNMAPGLASLHAPVAPASPSSSHYASSRSGSVSGAASDLNFARRHQPPPPYAPAFHANGASRSESESSYNDSGIAGHSAPNSALYQDSSMTSSSNTNVTNGYASPNHYRQQVRSLSASPAPSSPSYASAPAGLFNAASKAYAVRGGAENVYMPSLVEQAHNRELQRQPPPRPPRADPSHMSNGSALFSDFPTGSRQSEGDYSITGM